MLRLRTKEAIAIGVAITPARTMVATSDLAGRVIEEREFLTDADPEKTLPEVIADWIAAMPSDVRKVYDLPKRSYLFGAMPLMFLGRSPQW